MRGIYLRLFLAAALASGCYAISANPKPAKYEQPDGSKTPPLQLLGDEFYSWTEDPKGYTVIRDERGWYVYARKEDGALVSSGARVGKSNPRKLGLQPHLTDDSKNDMERTKSPYSEFDHTIERRGLLEVPGSKLCNFQSSKTNPCELINLAVMVRFSDHKSRDLPTTTDYDTLFNKVGGTTGKSNIAPTGSVADIFLQNSYGRFKLKTIVTPWIPVKRTEAQTVGDRRGLARPGTLDTWREAMNYLDTSRDIDLRKFDRDGNKYFDAVVIMHSGAGSEFGGVDCEDPKKDPEHRIWSHAHNGKFFKSKDGITIDRYYVASGLWGNCAPGGKGKRWDIARIGVITHECSHFLGLPDLYDTDSKGVGTFDMMGQAWGWGGTQLMPPLISAWGKMALRWVDVETVSKSTVLKVGPSCSFDKVYKITHNMPKGEFLLIEHRYACGCDAELNHPSGIQMYRGGIAIWHVDETGTMSHISHKSQGHPQDTKYPYHHYRLALLQGDGMYHLEKNENWGDESDLFRYDPSHTHSKSSATAYRIGPDGVTKNGGGKSPYPNTNAYSTGVEKWTGISIEVGEVSSTMTVKVDFLGEGEKPNNIKAKSLSSGCDNSPATMVEYTGVGQDPHEIRLVPCARIAKNPNKFCNLKERITGKKILDVCPNQCAKFCGAGSEKEAAPAPTPPPTQKATPPPTKKATPMGGDKAAKKAKALSKSTPSTCDNSPSTIVEYTGVGQTPDAIRLVPCSRIAKNPNKFCHLKERITGKKISDVCQNQCPELSGCAGGA